MGDGHHVEDGDIGYAGDTHRPFKPHQAPRVAYIRTTARGDAALSRIRSILAAANAARDAGKSPVPNPLNVTPDAYWAAISRAVRGFA